MIFLKNFDEINSISKVVIDSGLIVVGTQSGKILMFDSKSFKLINMFMAHTRKVTDMWVQHKKAIVSTSHDCKLYIKSLCDEFDD